MRKIIHQQLRLVPRRINHRHSDELHLMSSLLDSCGEINEMVYADLTCSGRSVDCGRNGMTAEQVLRSVLLKQMNSFSYEELAFHLCDSATYQAFCRIGIADKSPAASTLQENVSRIRPETLEAINHVLLRVAMDKGVEKGALSRVDCTVTESNIHPPTDSSLLWDCCRVLTRLLHCTAAVVRFGFTDHSRRAKRRMTEIDYARRRKNRTKPYKELVQVTEKMVRYAERAITLLETVSGTEKVIVQLRHYIGLTKRVIDQTRRRVFDGQSVPASEKIVSIFEPHTSIIRKGGRETHYGHKLCLAVGASGLVTDCLIEMGNPADSTLAVKMVERHQQLYSGPPRQVAFDGGFASKDNLAAIKQLGVTDVSFSKRCGLAINQMVKSLWVYRRLKRFRAGVEGCISFLKRAFGLRRSTWKGLAAFKRYVWSSLLSANLLIIARHLLE